MERPQPPDPPSFSIRLTTRWSEEDNHGVLNNAAYLTLQEEARLAYFRNLDLMQGRRFPFVLAQANTRFLAPGTGGAEVLVEARTTHVGTRSFRQSYRIREATSGTVWCEAEAVLVCIDAEGASAPMSAAFRARVTAFEDASASPR